jgi:hypothetical protein
MRLFFVPATSQDKDDIITVELRLFFLPATSQDKQARQ